MSERRRFLRHPEDQTIDEVLFCSTLPTTHEEAAASAFLRLGIRERYKTSGMSGDEWRFSTILQLRTLPSDAWEDTSSGYRDLECHAAALYPELYGDFKAGKNAWLYRRKVGGIAFAWKGRPVWCASYDGEATDLLVACGHLPWALITAPENGQYHEPTADACCQPGCVAPAVSVYRQRKEWCGRCSAEGQEPDRPQFRAFCAAHLRRGDCGLDDSDENYEVVSGPGPDNNEPDASLVRQSVFGGVVSFSAPGGEP